MVGAAVAASSSPQSSDKTVANLDSTTENMLHCAHNKLKNNLKKRKTQTQNRAQNAKQKAKTHTDRSERIIELKQLSKQ